MNTVHRSARWIGLIGAKGNVLEFPDDVDIHLVGEFVQKTARPGGTHLVHGEIERVGIFYHYVLRVLAADFEYRVHFRIDLDSPPGVRGDLVDHQIGTLENPPRHFARTRS